tara:strand:+ start:102 stop:296 length:195 start_codon:yes stop_codon:yes gene_type:complete
MSKSWQPIDVRDPMFGQLSSAASAQDPVAVLLLIETICGTDLAKSLALVDAIKSAYDKLADKGV